MHLSSKNAFPLFNSFIWLDKRVSTTIIFFFLHAPFYSLSPIDNNMAFLPIRKIIIEGVINGERNTLRYMDILPRTT